MTYLDWKILDALDEKAFRAAEPFPWTNPQGALTEEGRQALRAEPPDFSLFAKRFGVKRNYGQQPHDRWDLLYEDPLPPVPQVWKDFIAELSGARYRAFISRMFGVRRFDFRFYWQIATAGCSVSPHCDGTRKIGSQIFYLNDRDDWDPSWGGATLLLDDRGAIPWESAPSFDDFSREIASESLGNRSLIFARGDHAWHGVRPLTSPEGKTRRIFTVIVNRPAPLIERVKLLLKRP